MKITRLLATAGLVVASLGISTVAGAQNYGGGDRHDERRDDRDGRGRDGYRHDNGNHYGQDRGRGHRRCHTEYRHHHRITRCR